MNKKIPTAIIVIVSSVTFLGLTKPASAFWPFYTGMSGQVKGAETSTSPISGGFFGLMQSFLHHFGFGNPTVPATGSVNTQLFKTGEDTSPGFAGVMPPPMGSTGTSGMINYQDRINAAVQNGKITQAQGTELLNQLTAIDTQRQKLLSMEQSLQAWLKANNITTALLGPPVITPPYPSGMLNATGTQGINTQMAPHGTYRVNVPGGSDDGNEGSPNTRPPDGPMDY